MAEEMRVLYVALTRAKEKLILVGTVKDAPEKLRQWSSVMAHEDWTLPAHVRRDAKCYLDWIGPSLIRHQNVSHMVEGEVQPAEMIHQHASSWKLSTLLAGDLAEQPLEEQQHHEELLNALQKHEPVSESSDSKDEVYRRLNWSYDYRVASVHRSKQSVSELKRQQQLTDAGGSDDLVRGSKAPLENRPLFLQEKSLTGAERGTATHAVMQQLPLNKAYTLEMVQDFIQSMVTKELLTQEQADAVDANDVADFLDSDIAQGIRTARTVYREMPFSLGVSAKKIKKTVVFQKHNLLSDSFPKNVDLIVCRNVLIYFTDEAKHALYEKFSRALAPGGILFVGSTEQVFTPQKYGFETADTFFYRKVKTI